MTKIAIIDYGSGNLHSIYKAVIRASENIPNVSVQLTNNINTVTNASHIILPGVGAFGDCISGLKQIDGMIDILSHKTLDEKTPFLGICVGMQMLADLGYEHGQHAGLGWIKGRVLPLELAKPYKTPHMGWNELEFDISHPLFKQISPRDHAYFVHSYHFEAKNSANVVASTHYGKKLTAAIVNDNIMGVQFHPEKSQKLGIQLLKNFITEVK